MISPIKKLHPTVGYGAQNVASIPNDRIIFLVKKKKKKTLNKADPTIKQRKNFQNIFYFSRNIQNARDLKFIFD